MKLEKINQKNQMETCFNNKQDGWVERDNCYEFSYKGIKFELK